MYSMFNRDRGFKDVRSAYLLNDNIIILNKRDTKRKYADHQIKMKMTTMKEFIKLIRTPH